MPPGILLKGERGDLKKTDFKKLVSYPDIVIYYLDKGISIIIYRLSDIYLIQIRKRLFGTISDYY